MLITLWFSASYKMVWALGALGPIYHFILFFPSLRSKYDGKFLALQYAVDKAIMQMQTALSHRFYVKMQASMLIMQTWTVTCTL